MPTTRPAAIGLRLTNLIPPPGPGIIIVIVFALFMLFTSITKAEDREVTILDGVQWQLEGIPHHIVVYTEGVVFAYLIQDLSETAPCSYDCSDVAYVGKEIFFFDYPKDAQGRFTGGKAFVYKTKDTPDLYQQYDKEWHWFQREITDEGN